MRLDDDCEAEMIRYYAARAQEYDNWYLRLGRYSAGFTDVSVTEAARFFVAGPGRA